VRDWAVLVTSEPKKAPSSTAFRRLKEFFNEEQIVELTLRIALCGFFNRFNDALDIEMEPEAVEELLALEASPD
jgi:alkylhydroperoxidase family enzyme